ncbi:MAG: D-alanyl-D-alanine carboxypeptidase [Paenibacillaceae bacterium]|uniref:serine-type D-Ala-D-Ala carboxypeptidase n=1 Tax=Paenibacillus mellifer TaxID=2937794 RepID=A0A9X2BVH0_9BACL|nr:D-alanyl-D-alanine carboxypeptidase family protein [Paenibacillus mellifer]MBW4839055.1 D-alanyl-D-alanine carboxypeptidase [Paenibacillaceae bacterium]MCK8490176.1 D-alanyl-D-alanine carboxypeptidase [Paenibacillus mellifer]
MKHKQPQRKSTTKRRFLRKSVASVLLLNLLCFSLAPVMALAEGEQTESTSTESTTTETTTVQTTATSIPSVNSLGLEVSSAILLEPVSGQILLNVNGDQPLPPASMTKMMTEYIVAELVKQGKFSWDDVVTVGKNAAQTIGSRIFLAEGDQHTIEELYTAMAIASANDATVALAEHVAGSEQAFVKMMNDEAKRMGMNTAHFANSTGLDIADMPEGFRPADGQETVMSALDAAILAKYIVTDHPDFTRFTTIQSKKFRERDTSPMVNLNWMLEANKEVTNFKQFAYEGLDGLKTGHTSNAGNCFTGTAERNGMRLISVVMGTASDKARFVETRKVLDFGFNNFETKQIVPPKTTVAGTETVTVKKAKNTEIPVVTDQAVSFVVPKGADTSAVQPTVTLADEGTLTAPLKQGTKVGTVTYSFKAPGMDQTLEKTVNLITAEDAEKAGWFKLMMRAIGEFFSDLFNGIKNLF